MVVWRALLTLGLLSSLPLSAVQSCQAHMPGLPGIPGIPGRDGTDGADGAKGIAGPPGLHKGWEQGQLRGDPGVPGNPGKVGPKGPKGLSGPLGPTGPKGLKGISGEYKTDVHSAFSVKKTTMSAPRRDQPVRFERSLINIKEQFDVRTSKFSCQHRGIYYFTYHATSRGNLCASIMKGTPTSEKRKMVTFCEQIPNVFQLTTGGVVLQLNKDDTVWLETNDKNNMLGADGADTIFSGFLLFPL